MKPVHDFELPPELLNQAISNTVNGLSIADATQPDLPLIYVNPGFSRMTGYSTAEVIGQNCRFLQGEDRDQPGLNELRAAIREGRDCTVTLRNYRKDGSLFWNELTMSPIHDAQGNLTHFVGIQQDITARKRLEEQIQSTLARREHEVYTTIEVAQEIAAAPALEDLFRQVVELIQARFGYYHAHVYTLEGEVLVMQAGTGEAGRQMKAGGHQIGLGAKKSLVARAARTGQAVLVRDVFQAADWLPNELLPETHSELAVPISLREQVVGVLDVQSDQLGGLSEADQLLLLGLCGQIAVAIEHRRAETEQQAAEAALRESEGRLEEALEVAQLGHWELDLATLTFTFNDQFYALLHTTAEQEGGYYMPAPRYAEKFIPPEESHVVAEGTKLAIETTNPNFENQLEHRVIRADGSEGYFHVRVRIAKDEQGQTIRIYGANQDITERKLAELEQERLLAEMQESERLTRTIIDSTPDWIFIKDQNHLYQMVNRGYANSFHMEPEEFIGKNDLEVGFPEAIVKGDPEQGIRGFWADDRQVMDSGETKFVPSEPAVVDGEARTLSTIKVPLRDDSGAVWGVLGYVRDITENMRVQMQLETSEAQLSDALDIAQMAYWELDLASLKLILNDTYYAILGTTAEQEGGYEIALAEYTRRFVHPDDAHIIETETEKILAATDPAYSHQVEYRLMQPNGEERYVFVKFRITQNDQGQIVKAYGMLQDITEQKRVENERDRMFTQSLNLLCIAGFDGYFKRLNPAWENILGFSADELLSEPFLNIVHPDDRQAVEVEVENLAGGGETNGLEIRCRCQDGTYKWILWNATPFPNQGGFYATGQDITTRRQTEEALAHSLTQTEEQSQRLAHLNQMGAALQAATTTDQILQIASQQTLQIVSGGRASVALLMPSGDQFEILALSGIKGAIPTGTYLPIEGTIIGKCLTENQLMTMYRDDPTWDDYLDLHQLGKRGLQSTISAPLVAGGRQIGAVNIGSETPHAFSETEQSLMLQIAAILASAIDNQRLLEQMQTRVTELEIVAEVSTTVTNTLDPQHLLQEVVDLTKARFKLYHVHIYLLNEEDLLVLAAGADDIGRRMVAEGRTISLDQEQSLVARAARTRRGIIVNDVQADSGFLPHPLLPKTRSELVIPMIVGDQVLGVLDTQSDQVGYFTEADLQVKTTLASQVAVALQNAYQYEQTQEILAALQVNENRLFEALDIARMAHWELDFESMNLMVDDKFYEILGTTAEQEEGYIIPIEEYARRFVHPDDAHIIETEIEQSLATTDPSFNHQVEYRLTRANGEARHAFVKFRITQNDQGQTVKAYGMLQDVTEREQLLQETARLYQASQRINAAQDLQEVTAAVAEASDIRAFNRMTLLIFEYDDTDELTGLRLTANWYSGEGTLPTPVGTRYSRQDLTSLTVFLSAEPLFFDDVRQDERLDEATKKIVKALNIRSLAVLPLWKGSKQFGSFVMAAEESHHFTEREIRPSLALASQAAVAIDNQRLLEQVRTQASEMETVTEVSTAVTSILDPRQLLQEVVDLTKTSFNLDHVHVYLLKEEEGLVLTAGAGDIGRRMVAEGRTIPLDQGQSVVARAARTRQGVIVNNVEAEPDFLAHPLLPETRSEMAIPMFVGDRVLGVLDTQSDQIDYFTEEDMQIKTTLASQVAVALQNAYQYEQAQSILAALQQSETRLSEALDIARMAHWELDFESLTLITEDRFYALMNTTAEKEGGYHLPFDQFVTRFVHPDDAGIITQEVQTALNTSDPDYEGQIEYRLIRTNGEEAYASVSYKIVKDEQGRTVTAHGAFQDITARKQAEAKQSQLFALIEATPDMVALANPEGQTLYLNQAGRKMMGFGADEDLSQVSIPEYHPDWAVELIVNQGLPTALREGIWSSEMALLTRSGREIPASQVLIAQLNAEGKPEFFGTIIRDITEHKLVEAEMEENLRELRTIQQALSREGWQTLEETLSLPDGYIFDRATIQPVDELWAPELRLAAERKVLVPPSRAAEHDPEKSNQSKVAVAPLLVHNETIGAIGVYEDAERPLSPDELTLVKGVSEQVALALESARLFEESQRNSQLLGKRVRELNCMNDVGREIEKVPSIPQLLQWVTERIPTAMQFPDLCQVAIQFEDQIYGVAEAIDLSSQMVNGLYIGGEIRGRVYIAYTEKHDFLNEESALLGGIATRLSGYIENRHLFEQTRRRAEQERLINTITQKIQNTTTIEKALQTAVKELGQTFQARYTRVAIKTNGEGNSHQTPSNEPGGTDKSI